MSLILWCAFHGCPACFDPTSVSPLTGSVRKLDYESTKKRLAFIESKGFLVHTIWECAFNRQMKEDPELKILMDSLCVTSPLCPGDALYGGRVNAVSLHKSVSGLVEKIRFFYICSLYPYVCSRRPYPIGHPKIITEGFSDDLSSYFGLIKCFVLPPQDCFVPVLPVKSNGRLVFPLCFTCAEKINQKSRCTHTDEERGWEGTFVTEELNVALKRGYKVLRVYEVWSWSKISQYSERTQSGGAHGRIHKAVSPSKGRV